MSVQVSGEISLDQVIPLIDQLSEVEQEELRQFLATKPKIDWQAEWDAVVDYFQSIFKRFPAEDVEADLRKALNEVRSAKTD